MKKSHLVQILGFIFIIVIGMLSFACTDKKENTALIVGLERGVRMLDPRLATDAMSMKMNRLLYDGLFRIGESLNAEPHLVSGIQQPNDKSYVFTIRKDVFFHNGDPLTTSDIAYTFQSILKGDVKSAFKGSLEKIKEITVLSPTKIRFDLHAPYPAILTTWTMGIVSEKYAKQMKNEFGQQPMGSGAYRLISLVKDSIIKLEATNTHFHLKPKIRNVTFEIIKDDNVRVMKLMKGDIHVVMNSIPASLLSKLLEDPNIKHETGTSAVIAYLGYNMTDPMLKDVNIRQALAYGIDRDAIISHRFKGLAQKANSLLAPSNWAYDATLRGYDYNVKKAKQLLDNAGYTDPDGDGPKSRFKLVYKTSNNKERIDIAHMISQQLKAIGVDVEVKTYEWGRFYSDIKSGNFQLYSLSWSLLTEPDFFYDVCHSSKWPPNGVNRNRYKNSIVDGYVEKARISINSEKRKQYYHMVQKIVLDELPWVPMWYESNSTVYRSDLEGIRLRTDAGFSVVADISFKK